MVHALGRRQHRADHAGGVITAQSKVVKGSEPTGITVAPDSSPWFTMFGTDKIATLRLK